MVGAALAGADRRVPVLSEGRDILDSPELPWLSRSWPDRREQRRSGGHSFIHSYTHSRVCAQSHPTLL